MSASHQRSRCIDSRPRRILSDTPALTRRGRRPEMRDEEERGLTMADHKTHEKHEHTHGPTCEHKAIEHEGHKDYLHDGHLHHLHEGHVDEHVLAAGKTNPPACTPSPTCAPHEKSHVHGGN